MYHFAGVLRVQSESQRAPPAGEGRVLEWLDPAWLALQRERGTNYVHTDVIGRFLTIYLAQDAVEWFDASGRLSATYARYRADTRRAASSRDPLTRGVLDIIVIGEVCSLFSAIAQESVANDVHATVTDGAGVARVAANANTWPGEHD